MSIPVPDNPHHVENMESISLLEEQGYQGPDVSLAISLFEYGLAWKDLGEETQFIHRNPNHQRWFDRIAFPNDLDVRKEFDWADWEDGLMSFLGGSLEEWLEFPLPRKIQDLVSYYGEENIFGTSYWEGFQIKDK